MVLKVSGVRPVGTALGTMGGSLADFATTFRRTWMSEPSLRARGLSPLTQQQLQERYARRVESRFENNQGALGTFSVMPDGSVRRSAHVEDVGTWRIKDGRFCTSFQRIRQGEEECRTLYRTGDWEFSFFSSFSSPLGAIGGVFIDVD